MDKISAVRSAWQDNFPDTVIDRKLGDATGHQYYAAAKKGDSKAAFALAGNLISDEAVKKVTQLVGDGAIAVPVLAEEMQGRNKIPLATSMILAKRIPNLTTTTDIVQSTKVSRSGTDGWYRLAHAPQFDGKVEQGAKYLLIDDTQTQGGTFAALKGFIENRGGTVVGAYALTGKQYSVQLRLSKETLQELRGKYGEIEPWWEQQFGYDFSKLTEWEAKFIINSRKTPDAVRDCVITSGNDG